MIRVSPAHRKKLKSSRCGFLKTVLTQRQPKEGLDTNHFKSRSWRLWCLRTESDFTIIRRSKAETLSTWTSSVGLMKGSQRWRRSCRQPGHTNTAWALIILEPRCKTSCVCVVRSQNETTCEDSAQKARRLHSDRRCLHSDVWSHRKCLTRTNTAPPPSEFWDPAYAPGPSLHVQQRQKSSLMICVNMPVA